MSRVGAGKLFTSMTLSEAFALYRLDCIVYRNQSLRTEEHYDLCMRSLTDFVGDIDVEVLTFPQIRNWKLKLDKTLTASSVRNYLCCLRMVVRYLYRKGVKTIDPDLILLPKRDDKVPDFITPEQVQLLIDCCIRLRSKAIISLFYASGIRLSELISLNRSDMKSNTFTVIGKGNKARLCFYDERTKKYLKSYLKTRKDNHPALFVSTQQEIRMTPTNIQYILKAARHKSGITEVVTPHVLRHSYATNLLRNNANLRYVQTMLGHANIATTMRYTHVVDEDLRQIYEKYHSV